MLPSLRRGIMTLCSRRIYIFMMVIVPLGCAFFFLNLMHEGLPLKVPVAMVDMDHSTLSRRIGRSLNASELIDISVDCESFHSAIDKVRSGEIFGFFYIPTDFQEKALSGRTPTLSFYSNMTIFVPGTLSFKGFKTIAVTTSGGIVQTTLTSAGVDDNTVGSLITPLKTDIHPIGNPWTNYSIYLSQSFLAGVMALLVMLVTSFSICQGAQARHLPRVACHSQRLHAARARWQAPPTECGVHIGGCGHTVHHVSISPLPAQLLSMAYDTGHDAAGAFLPGLLTGDSRDCPQPAPLPEHMQPHRHPVLLGGRLLLSGRKNVWLNRHICLPHAHTLLFPHLHRPGSQRTPALLLALLLYSHARDAVCAGAGTQTSAHPLPQPGIYSLTLHSYEMV